jgi:hypothetical protein
MLPSVIRLPCVGSSLIPVDMAMWVVLVAQRAQMALVPTTPASGVITSKSIQLVLHDRLELRKELRDADLPLLQTRNSVQQSRSVRDGLTYPSH